jgi:hypothetical protein
MNLKQKSPAGGHLAGHEIMNPEKSNNAPGADNVNSYSIVNDQKREVTERNLLRRINRRLAKENQMVKKLPPRWRSNGLYMLVDLTNNAGYPFDDLEETAKEVGALFSGEAISTEE